MQPEGTRDAPKCGHQVEIAYNVAQRSTGVPLAGWSFSCRETIAPYSKKIAKEGFFDSTARLVYCDE